MTRFSFYTIVRVYDDKDAATTSRWSKTYETEESGTNLLGYEGVAEEVRGPMEDWGHQIMENIDLVDYFDELRKTGYYEVEGSFTAEGHTDYFGEYDEDYTFEDDCVYRKIHELDEGDKIYYPESEISSVNPTNAV